MRRTLENILTVALTVLAIAIACVLLTAPSAVQAQSQPPRVGIMGYDVSTTRSLPFATDPAGAFFVRGDHPTRWHASLDNIGATLTELKAAPSPTTAALYLTGYMAGSTTTTAGQHLLRQGTDANCGTGTATLFPGTGTTARVPSPANTVAPTVVAFNPPVKLSAGRALCIIGVATNTTWIVATGFTAP